MAANNKPERACANFQAGAEPSPLHIWNFDADPTIPVSESRQLVAALLGRGADIRYTEYPGVGHNSWDNAYAEPRLLPWLLSHKLRKSDR